MYGSANLASAFLPRDGGGVVKNSSSSIMNFSNKTNTHSVNPKKWENKKGFGTRSNETKNENVVVHTFDIQRYTDLYQMFSDTTSVQNCIHTIQNILCGQLQIKGNVKKFQKYLEDYYIPFLKDALLQFFLVGWCAYMIREDQDIPYPISVPLDRGYVFSIEENIRTLKNKFVINDARTGKNVHNIYILQKSNIEPLLRNGMIHSLLDPLVSDYRVYFQNTRFFLQSTFLLSNPPLFMNREKIPKPTPAENKANNAIDNAILSAREFGIPGNLRSGSAFLDTNANSAVDLLFPSLSVPESTPQVVPNTDSESFQALMESQQTQHQVQLENLSKQQQRGLGLEFQPQWYNNCFMTPQDLILERPNQPGNLLETYSRVRSDFNRTVYDHFHIPSSMTKQIANISGSGGGSQSIARSFISTIMEQQYFEEFLREYREILQELVCLIYFQIFGRVLEREQVLLELPETFSEKYIVRHLENGWNTERNLGKEKEERKRKRERDDSDSDSENDSDSESDKSVSKSDKSVSKSESVSKSDKSVSKSDKSVSKSDKSVSKSDKSVSKPKNGGVSSNKIKKTTSESEVDKNENEKSANKPKNGGVGSKKIDKESSKNKKQKKK